MSVRKVVLIRPITEEYQLVGTQVAVNLRQRKLQEILERKNRICNVVSARLERESR